MNPKIRRFMTRYCSQLQTTQFWLLMLASILFGGAGASALLSQYFERAQDRMYKEARIEREEAVAEARKQAATEITEANRRAEQFAEIALQRIDNATGNISKVANQVKNAGTAARTAAKSAKEVAKEVRDLTNQPQAPSEAPDWLNTP